MLACVCRYAENCWLNADGVGELCLAIPRTLLARLGYSVTIRLPFGGQCVEDAQRRLAFDVKVLLGAQLGVVESGVLIHLDVGQRLHRVVVVAALRAVARRRMCGRRRLLGGV